MKLTKGVIIRLESFAHVEPDGKMKGFSASPDGTPEDEREVFVCVMLSKEPTMLPVEQRPLWELNLKSELNLLGWFQLADLEAMMRENTGPVGVIFKKVQAELAGEK